MLYEAIHKVRLWLAERQVKALARDLRPCGTGEGDWIGANVAASAASSGSGVGHHAAPACGAGTAASDGASAGSC